LNADKNLIVNGKQESWLTDVDAKSLPHLASNYYWFSKLKSGFWATPT